MRQFSSNCYCPRKATIFSPLFYNSWLLENTNELALIPHRHHCRNVFNIFLIQFNHQDHLTLNKIWIFINFILRKTFSKPIFEISWKCNSHPYFTNWTIFKVDRNWNSKNNWKNIFRILPIIITEELFNTQQLK